MRRRWGRTFPAARNWPPPKPVPRRWGKKRWSLGASRFKPAGTSASRGWSPRPKPRWGSGGSPSQGGSGSGAKGWMPRKPRRRLKRGQKWLLIALLLLFAAIQSFLFFDRKLKPPLLFLAQVRVKQMATEAINTAITQELARTADADRMIQWKLDREGKVTGFLIDYKEQMMLTSRTIQIVERVLKEKEETPDHVPLGHALNSPLLSAFGPRLSVTFHPASAVQADVDTRQTETAINMLLVEVFIRIRTEIAVVIPFDQAPETLETEIPLSYALVVGDVPMYYYDGNGNPVGSDAGRAPAITLPAPPTQSEPSGQNAPSAPQSGPGAQDAGNGH